MLSILIPTYNYNAFALVSAVHEQVAQTNVPFEIICIDDASAMFFLENEAINQLSHSRYEQLTNNIGRSKIRNLLAKKAKYDWLLFLDADVFPKSENFIETYLPYLNGEPKIINGGLVYQQEKPKKEKLLRWVYGKNREALSYKQREKNPYLSFLTLNFVIHKSVFSKVHFNEEIPNLRHEDTLFSYNLKQHQIPIMHIDNPIIHLGLDAFEDMIKKEKESLYVLKYLTEIHLLAPDYLRISTLYYQLKKLKLLGFGAFCFKTMRSVFLQNLAGNSPSLLVFDFYRLGYLCTLNKS